MAYAVSLLASGVSMTLATDLAQITVADDKPLKIVGLTIVQSSDVGDAAEEVLRWGLYSGVTTGSTGGTALTVGALDRIGAVTPGASGQSNWTTASTSGTLIAVGGFNIRVGESWWPPPEVWPVLGQGQSPFSFRLLAAPTDALTLDICVYVLEG